MGRALLLGLAGVALLGGCGAAKRALPTETAPCRVITSAALGQARLLLRDEAGVDASPADLPFYNLRVDLANTQARCLPAWLGDDLRLLPAGRLAALYRLLPTTYVTYLQLALGCAQDGGRPVCATRPRTIHSPGSTGSGNPPHPVTP